MWIFDIFKKKAELSIVLEKNTFSYSEIVKWKVIITPLEDFTSNKLVIWIEYNGWDINVYDKIERLAFPWTDFYKWNKIEINFEFEFFKYNELKDIVWNEFNWEEESEQDVEDELEEEWTQSYYVYSHFDIPWFDVSEKTEITLNK